MHSGIEGIIFDLDGVLVNADGWHEEAFIRAMSDYGYEVSPNLKRKGYSTLGRLKALSQMGRAPQDFKAVAELKQKYTKETVEARCVPVDRIIEAVDFAARYTNGKIAVATNCSKISAIEMLTRSGLITFFDIVVTSNDVKGKLKPHPKLYLEASYGLGIFSKKCLAIDDCDIGILSAVDAMCRTLRIRNFNDLDADLIRQELKALEIRI